VSKPRVANHSALASPGASLTTTIGLSIGGAPAFEAYGQGSGGGDGILAGLGTLEPRVLKF